MASIPIIIARYCHELASRGIIRKMVFKYILLCSTIISGISYGQSISSGEPKKTIERYVQAFNAMDLDSLIATLSPRVTAFDFNYLYNEFRELKDFPRNFYHFDDPDLKVDLKVLEQIVSGSFITQRQNVTWTGQDGRREGITSTTIFKVRNGLIDRIWFLPFEPKPSSAPTVTEPTFAAGKGPTVHVDAAHFNFHIPEASYWPFAQLLRRDGYVVRTWEEDFTRDELSAVKILVISNALNERNVDDWSLPTPSAFTEEEIVAVKTWVEEGGALLLIADHMPWPGAASDLASVFGFQFNNGFARDTLNQGIFRRSDGSLADHSITNGRIGIERIDSVSTYTGQAFQTTEEAEPLLVFGPSAFSLMPEVAWQFKDDTPRIPVNGWFQGAVLHYGKGRIAVFGEAAMFRILTPEIGGESIGQNAQFALNVMHWLTGLAPD